MQGPEAALARTEKPDLETFVGDICKEPDIDVPKENGKRAVGIDLKEGVPAGDGVTRRLGTPKGVPDIAYPDVIGEGVLAKALADMDIAGMQEAFRLDHDRNGQRRGGAEGSDVVHYVWIAACGAVEGRGAE
jgi:hypothetical protein